MGHKKLTQEDMYKIDELLSKAEEILRNTLLDDECYLLNHIRSYIWKKRKVGIEKEVTGYGKKEKKDM